MHGLRTSSVLILDDNKDEALQIQKSLALRGIGAILVLGGPEEQLPSEPITGIRVAVLDIHLQRTTSPDDEIVNTKAIVDAIIAKENGPYVAVVWTGRSGDFESFRNQLQQIKCPPVDTVELSKAQVLRDGSTQQTQVEEILETIGQALADVPPLEFSNLWEQLVRDAANDTIVSLQLDQTSQLKNSRAMAFLAALLRSEAGNALDNDQNAAKALLAALNPVHFDKVEERSARTADDLEKTAGPIREAALDRSIKLDPAERAQINTAFLFDQQAEGLGAGHIYRFEDI